MAGTTGGSQSSSLGLFAKTRGLSHSSIFLKGDRIEERIFEELPKCKELVALLTPWSVTRNWVWNEIGAAWILNMRIVAVLYGVSLAEIDAEKGGRACLTSRNAVLLDDFDDYIDELAVRVKGAS